MLEITFREPIWEEGDDPAAISRAILNSPNDSPRSGIDNFLSDTMNEIRDFYATKGLPDPEREVSYNEQGIWSYICPNDTTPMRRCTASYFVEKFTPPMSRESLLSNAVDHIKYWRRDNRLGAIDATNGNMRLIRVGMILEMVRLRDSHLSEVTEAQAIAKGRRVAADMVNAQFQGQRQARLEEMRRLVPKLGVNAAARNLEARGFGGWQGIKRQWNRHR
ncbi:hypothetical protein [Loktanella salsilacus]|uniref:hypothetical protein n=1 Tax=Loktanella salsilacus TaxID=195913 RepID=UPI0037365FC0